MIKNYERRLSFMKSLMTLLREEDQLVEKFNEQMCTMSLCAKDIRDIHSIDHECQAKQDDLAHYQGVAAKAKSRASEIARDITDTREHIRARFNADRTFNTLLLNKEIKDIMLKG